jgi:hypothetical protein
MFVQLHVACRLVASRMQILHATVACRLRPRLSLLRLEHDDPGSCQIGHRLEEQIVYWAHHASYARLVR